MPSYERFRTSMIVASAALGAPLAASAQALGPQRQLLVVEPYYAHIQLDQGKGRGRISLDGYGARLWVNLAPFSGSSPNVIGKTALALFAHYTPDRGGSDITTWHYGAELDTHFVDYPIAGRLDPFVSLGAGAFRTRASGAGGAYGAGAATSTKFAFTPGLGVRVPLANRLQLRGDARDMIIFSQRQAVGANCTINNPEFLAGLGITF